MPATPKGWERLAPGYRPGKVVRRRLVSQDDRMHVLMFRQVDGPHAGWRWLWEWLDSRHSWEFLVRDEHSNVVAQVFGETVEDALEAANAILWSKGYEPLPA
jgi:hypothetical protein